MHACKQSPGMHTTGTMMTESLNILVLYYSTTGHTKNMANAIALGIESTGVAEAVLRCVPEVSATSAQTSPAVPDQGAPYASQEDFERCDGLAMGSPTHFGNMAAPLKYFLDQTGPAWFSGAMVNKPFTVFTSTGSLHGGQESTLLSMMLPCIHHGMIYAGLPYTEQALHQTQTGGSPYGATHWSQNNTQHQLSPHEKSLCVAMGKRLAQLAYKLRSPMPSTA